MNEENRHLTLLVHCKSLLQNICPKYSFFVLMASLVGRRRLSELRWFSWERSREIEWYHVVVKHLNAVSGPPILHHCFSTVILLTLVVSFQTCTT